MLFPLHYDSPIIMSDPAKPSPVPPASLNPLGLPAGSIRAILALVIVAVVVSQTLRAQPVGELWMQALMIALAHYYTTRRFIELPTDVLRRLEADGVLEHEPSPLFLPKYSIRILMVLVFVGLAVLLYRQDRLWEPAAVGLLGNVFAYFLGIIWKILQGWFMRGRTSVWARWKDVKATLVILALAVAAGMHLLGFSESTPKFVDQTAVGLVLFYFGSR